MICSSDPFRSQPSHWLLEINYITFVLKRYTFENYEKKLVVKIESLDFASNKYIYFYDIINMICNVYVYKEPLKVLIYFTIDYSKYN